MRRGKLAALSEPDRIGFSGKEIMDIKLLRKTFNNFTSENGFTFSALETEDENAIEIVIEDRQEFPILVSADDEQILCLTYLWSEDQIKPEGRTEMLATLLG